MRFATIKLNGAEVAGIVTKKGVLPVACLNAVKGTAWAEDMMSLIQKPRPGENGIWMSLKDLSALIKQHFRNYQEDEGSFIKIGSYLQRPEYKFERKHSNTGMKYWVKIKI